MICYSIWIPLTVIHFWVYTSEVLIQYEFNRVLFIVKVLFNLDILGCYAIWIYLAIIHV